MAIVADASVLLVVLTGLSMHMVLKVIKIWARILVFTATPILLCSAIYYKRL